MKKRKEIYRGAKLFRGPHLRLLICLEADTRGGSSSQLQGQGQRAIQAAHRRSSRMGAQRGLTVICRFIDMKWGLIVQPCESCSTQRGCRPSKSTTLRTTCGEQVKAIGIFIDGSNTTHYCYSRFCWLAWRVRCSSCVSETSVKSARSSNSGQSPTHTRLRG